MTYEDFLFSQLFMNHIENNETEYQELEYDLIFPEVLKHQKLFLKSNFKAESLKLISISFLLTLMDSIQNLSV